MIRVCFVCLGNICRSPTAEAVFASVIEKAKLTDTVQIESAGTAAYHAGESPDRRATAAAARRGYTMRSQARQFVAEDFERFDFVLAMDQENLENLRALRTGPGSARLALLRSFEPDSAEGAEVPDPYYGGSGGFEEVLDLCEAACAGLLARIAR